MSIIKVYDRELKYDNDYINKNAFFSEFEEHIISFLHNKTPYPEYQFAADLNAFFCLRTNTSSSASNITIEKIKNYLSNKVEAIYDFIDDETEMGVPYRLMDYFPNRRLEAFIQSIDKEQQDLADGGILNLVPFFHCCRSDYYIRHITQSVLQQIFVSQLDTNYVGGKSHPFWEIWDDSFFLRGTPNNIIINKNITSMACYAFMWYRLRSKFPEDGNYHKINNLVSDIIQLLIENQLPNGSWPSINNDSPGSVESTCMVVHALCLCPNQAIEESIKAAGEWLLAQWKSSDCVDHAPGFDCLWIDSISMCLGHYNLVSFKIRKNKVGEKEKMNIPFTNKQREYVYSISDRLAFLSIQSKSENKANLTDGAILAESFIWQLLNVMNGWHLKNANVEHPNAKGIDLISEKEKVIVQVTSNNNREKILKTINAIDCEQYDGYRLLILILGEKKNYKFIPAPNYVIFDAENDIWDIPFLIRSISDLEINKLAKLYKLTNQFYRKEATKAEKKQEDKKEPLITTSPAAGKTSFALTPKPTLFVSYCGKDAPVATAVKDQLTDLLGDNIVFSVYTELNYRESFKKFMDSIQDHDYVLCIVSDHYLKSKPCMYEVGEIIKDKHYIDRLLFIVIGQDDEKYYIGNKKNFAPPTIYGSEAERLEYVEYWKNQYETLDRKLKAIGDPTATRNSYDELYEIEKIYKNDIGEFLNFLSYYNGKSLTYHFSENFLTMIRQIFPKYNKRIFDSANNINDLLKAAIIKVSEITRTDYNQIALNARYSSYDNSLIVFADNITGDGKQVYRKVHMKGLMGKSFSDGSTFNITSTKDCPEYFSAVSETNSEVVVPIKIRGDIVGVINSESEQENHYSNSMVDGLSNLAHELGIALKRLSYSKRMNAADLPYIHNGQSI